jgi:hypothetical protein
MSRRRPNPQPFARQASRLIRGIRMGLGQASNLLTPAQIRYYAQNAGFGGSDLDTAVAIALAESSGNAYNYNSETAAGAPAGKGSYGLWQIYLQAHPEYTGANLYDPQTNARAAYAIFSAAGGFSPWSSYKSGRYQTYLGPGATAPGPVTIDASTGEVIPNAPDVANMPSIDSNGNIISAAANSPAGMYLGLGALALGVWMLADVIRDW